nr:MvaI/BcnI family restriction endonuclease [Loktanella sp. M215]
MGWEVKQYGVNDFTSYRAKGAVTLMTPEPTGGLYRDEGVAAFLNRYGYADKSGKADRINFGGIYTASRDFHADTGLMLRLDGFDAATGKITDFDGGIVLLDRDNTVAASWGFRGIMAHWNRKHAKAVYVPSLMQFPPPEYSYGGVVQLCEGTDVLPPAGGGFSRKRLLRSGHQDGSCGISKAADQAPEPVSSPAR